MFRRALQKETQDFLGTNAISCLQVHQAHVLLKLTRFHIAVNTPAEAIFPWRSSKKAPKKCARNIPQASPSLPNERNSLIRLVMGQWGMFHSILERSQRSGEPSRSNDPCRPKQSLECAMSQHTKKANRNFCIKQLPLARVHSMSLLFLGLLALQPYTLPTCEYKAFHRSSLLAQLCCHETSWDLHRTAAAARRDPQEASTGSSGNKTQWRLKYWLVSDKTLLLWLLRISIQVCSIAKSRIYRIYINYISRALSQVLLLKPSIQSVVFGRSVQRISLHQSTNPCLRHVYVLGSSEVAVSWEVAPSDAPF